jgi:hypothetical protein
MPVVNMVFTFFALNVFSAVLYKIKANPALIFNLLFFILLILCETLSASILAFNKNIPFHTLLTDDHVMPLAYLMNVVITFAATRILILLLSKRAGGRVGSAEILILVFMTIFESYIIHSYVLSASETSELFVILVIILGFFALNVFIIYEINRLSELLRTKYEADIIKQQNNLQLTHYNEMIDNYNHYRKIVHDIRKHMTILTGMNTSDDGHYKEYARTITEKMDLLFDEYETKCPILSIIMTQKIRIAKNLGIKLILRMEDINLSFISDTDITSIFANLWDNALEACTELPTEQRLINISLVKKGEIIIVQFENSFSGKIKTAQTKDSPRERYLTTKDSSHAGLGLQIIETAIEKYNGHFMIAVSSDLFTATIMLPSE